MERKTDIRGNENIPDQYTYWPICRLRQAYDSVRGDMTIRDNILEFGIWKTLGKLIKTCTHVVPAVFLLLFLLIGVRLSPLGTAATVGLLYQPQMIDDGDCGPIGGIRFGRENRSTRRKPTPAPLCPPQIPHDQTLARTRAAAVGSQRLTA
jgi:hypothetical protein